MNKKYLFNRVSESRSFAKILKGGVVVVAMAGLVGFVSGQTTFADEVSSDTVVGVVVEDTTKSADVGETTSTEDTGKTADAGETTSMEDTVKTADVGETTSAEDTVKTADAGETTSAEDTTKLADLELNVVDEASSDTTDLSSVVDSKVTIKLNDSTVNGFGTNGAFTIVATLKTGNEGDYIVYNYENLPNVHLMNGATVSDQNGNVIGTITVKNTNLYSVQLGNDKAAKANLKLGMNVGTLKIVFGKNIVGLQDITFVISSKDSYQTVVASPDPWEMTSKVILDGKVVAEDTTTIEAASTVKLNDVATLDGNAARFYNSVDGKGDIHNMELVVYSSDTDKAGTVYTISDIVGGNIDTSKIKVGDQFVLSQKRAFSTAVVNAYNAYVNDMASVKAVVEAVGTDFVKIKLLEDLNVGGYGGYLPMIYDASKVVDGYVNVTAKSTISNKDKVADVKTKVEESGATTSVTGIYRGVLIVQHLDDQGNVLEVENPVRAAVGTEYKTSSKDFEGYDLVELPDNQNGTYKKGNIVVFYVYKKAEGTLNVRYVDNQGNVLEVEKPTKGLYGSSYQTEPKEIDGYELVELPDNQNGTFTKGDITVTYVYKKVLKDNVTPMPEPDPGYNLITNDTPKNEPGTSVEVPNDSSSQVSVPEPSSTVEYETKDVLPSTGETSSVAVSIFGVVLLAIAGLVTRFGFKKQED